MGWNNSSERQRFEKAQRKQAKKYKELGMSDEQIRAMYEFDLKQFQSDRRFYSHTVLLEKEWCDSSEENSDGDSSMLVSTIDAPEGHSRFWWIEELDDPELARRIKMLSECERVILSMYVFERMSQVEISAALGISQPTLSRQIKKIEVFLQKVNKNGVLAG